MTHFKNKHRGERCFIIGNGPSLRQTNLPLLKDEVTFGMNRFYMAFDEIEFSTTYYVSVNELVLEQFGADICKFSMPKFLSWPGRTYLPFGPNTMFMHCAHDFGFSKDIRRHVSSGATVTYVAMQIAYFMGFSQVFLIGVDHRFETRGEAHTTVVSEGDDPNHFHPRYFGKNVRWQLPDLAGSERAYRTAKEVFKATGREIIDATVGGNLQVFNKVDFNHLF